MRCAAGFATGFGAKAMPLRAPRRAAVHYRRAIRAEGNITEDFYCGEADDYVLWRALPPLRRRPRRPRHTQSD